MNAFSPLLVTSTDIGDTKEGLTVEIAPGVDYDLEGYGMMFGHHAKADTGRFAHARLWGNFDVSVRIASLRNDIDALAEAGLMVRKSLEPESPFVSQFASSNEYPRDTIDYTLTARMAPGEKYAGNALISGYDHLFDGRWEGAPHRFVFSCLYWSKTNDRPRPFPNVWTRIRRTGNTYEGFIKTDREGNPWVRLGSVLLDLGEEPYVGLAITANHHGGNKDVRATARFRELQAMTSSR